ncbi:vacuolar protein sorting-associated protein 9A [Selaginella moellendorffii]|nr:vacuolar protein sorting-associated protein 9A [Selaginella moellendorffii]|eukprot:XP_002989534.2 vacuolar protein sorting-associated protein 9A [Selaginella moellendorffii]
MCHADGLGLSSRVFRARRLVEAAMENSDMFNAATKQQTFHDFLERMKHPSAADLVRSIKSFIVNFMSSPIDPAMDSASAQDFLSTTEVAFRAHPLWAGATEEELENAAEGLEKYVMTKIFTRAYSPLPSDSLKDQELSDKISLLQHFIKPEHLDLPQSFQNEASWLIAEKELQKINSYKAPRDKLVCILNCCRVINNLLLMAKSGTPPGAEEFLPALIYVVIKANPPQLHSNLQFIERYRHSSRLVAEASYFYTSLVSVESFIEKLDAKSLSMDEAEFEERMQNARSVVFPPGLPSTPPEKLLLPKEKEGSITKPDEATKRTAKESSELSVAKLEAGGASGVVEADRSGQLAKEYPFLYASAGDLRVEDVESLLTQYKELVLRYVALRKGLESIGRKPAIVEEPPSPAPALAAPVPAPAPSETIAAQDGGSTCSNSTIDDALHDSIPELSWERPHDEEQWEKVNEQQSHHGGGGSEANDSDPVVIT